MGTKVFTTTVQMQDYFSNAVGIAVKNASEIIMTKLREFVNTQYYNDSGFYPNVYNRTETFLSACAYQMLSSNMSEVGIDTEKMNYRNGFSGDQVVEWAAQSMHGSPNYQTDTLNFWDAFLDWVNVNAIPILRAEILKQLNK